MIFTIYVIKNKVIQAFERPIFAQDSSEEFIERITRDYRASDKLAQAKMVECEVYEAGVFDDNTGVITPHTLVPIFDIGTLKEVSEDGN